MAVAVEQAVSEYFPGSALDAGAIQGLNGTFSGINNDEAADWLMNNRNIIYLERAGRILVYENGIYVDGDALLKKDLYDVFKGCKNASKKAIISMHGVKEILGRVKANSVEPATIFTCDPNLVNLDNGVLNLQTLEVVEHSPDYYFLNKLPVRYDPAGECPNFIEYRNQTLESKYHPVLEEIIGYILWGDCRAEKAFMLWGDKRTGKGTMVKILNCLIGQDNCSSVQLQELATNRFKIVNLFGKKLNTFGDLPRTVVMDVGQFKALTGGDLVEGEYKGVQSFTFFNRAKLLYSTNYLPILREYDDAYYNRWIILRYNNSFFGKEDASLKDKLTTPEELSGILNLGLKGLARLKVNNWQFSTTEDFGKLYLRGSNPVAAFLEDEYQECDGISYVPKAKLLSDFSRYARENKLDPISSATMFGKKIKEQSVIPVESGWRGTQGNQVEVWVGLIKKPKPT
jgi:putative DNA primase/helicase